MQGSSAGLRLLRAVGGKHPTTVIALLLFGVVWLLLVFWLYAFCGVAGEWQSWIELFNGATWPADWAAQQRSHRFWFAATLATRTVVNIAGPIGGVAATVWFVRGGLERYMEMTLVEMLRMHNVELVSNLALVLKKRHPETITSEDVDVMQEEAKRFLSEWQRELKVKRSE